MYKLYAIDYHFGGYKEIGTIKTNNPSLDDIISLIKENEGGGGNWVNVIRSVSVDQLKKVFTSDCYPVPATQKFIEQSKIISAFGIEPGDEDNTYFLTEEVQVNDIHLRYNEETDMYNVISDALCLHARDDEFTAEELRCALLDGDERRVILERY